jgi:cell fate regulator YaaT (PSP1 superfamily)
MPDIVGIRFKKAGKVYYFDPSGIELKVNDYVVVQTARGIEMGQVTIASKQVLVSEITAELKPIVRKASEEDNKRAQDYSAKESSAMEECSKMIRKLNLPMKLVSAEYNLDGGRLTFYFTAEERVDFRELVRELTAFFKTRIELRQIGPRDQAKMVGGLGRCGRKLCCGSFLTEFSPVSIKMAKEQDLPLDPMKISGVCGRLQCCLAYESAQYHEAKALLPKRGLTVQTPDGIGIVIGGNPLKETVQVEMESKAVAEFPLDKVNIISPVAPQPPVEPPAAAPSAGQPGAMAASKPAETASEMPPGTEPSVEGKQAEVLAAVEIPGTESAAGPPQSVQTPGLPVPAEAGAPVAKPPEQLAVVPPPPAITAGTAVDETSPRQTENQAAPDKPEEKKEDQT